MLRRNLLIGGAALAASPARAQPTPVRISHGYGIHYLPLMVMRDRNLIEKNAEAAGAGPIEPNWRLLDGGNTINDAMLSGALDLAGTGAPGFLTLWAKARSGGSAVIGVCGLGNGALWLNTNRADRTSLRDFTDGDKIAVPGIKTSFAAVVLQMAAAKEFGDENFAKLDTLTVSMPHPEALAALVSGKTEITAHVASPPFSNKELTYPNIHRVFTSLDILGPITIDVVFASKRFAAANPAIMTAFLAAKAEADALIAADKDAAAESFARISKVNMPHAAIRALLDDEETSFTVEPRGILKYATFLTRTGAIRNPPAVWTELFIPQVHALAGS